MCFCLRVNLSAFSQANSDAWTAFKDAHILINLKSVPRFSLRCCMQALCIFLGDGTRFNCSRLTEKEKKNTFFSGAFVGPRNNRQESLEAEW